MATYNGRRAPNVSQYLANLNAVPSAQEVSAQDELHLGDDGLDFLTNTQFFDFDEFNGNNGFDHAAQDALSQQQPVKNAAHQPYHFADFPSYPTGGVPSPSDIASPQTAGLPTGPYSHHAVAAAAAAAAGQHFAQTSPASGEKRSADAADLEESSRLAAEEDKRRRNTAASARFRVKKKQREQALEKQAKEMSDKVQVLEGKVQQLEMENKWLKELITEKSDVKTVNASLLEKRSAAAAAAAAATAAAATANANTADRIAGSHTDGVGTALDDDEEDEADDEDALKAEE